MESLYTYNGTLKKLVLFENFNQQYPGDHRLFCHGEDLSGRDSFRKPSPAISRAVAIASLALEHVAASYLVDAGDFFTLDPPWEWRKLESLRLTSSLFTPDGDTFAIGALLEAAASAACKMPRLEVMELWNGQKGVAGLFRYQASRKMRQARITWKGTWRLIWDPSVTQAWETAAAKHGCEDGYLDWVQEEVDAAVIKSHADAIHHFMLSGKVLRPISLQQIQREQDALEGVPTE